MKTTMRDRAYFSRLGGLIDGGLAPSMRMSRAIQICRTWRMHFAWHLTRALTHLRGDQ